jgi:basic membrane protein A
MTNFKRHFGALAAGIAATAMLTGMALADPAVLYDGGGKNDKSFNEATFTGAEQYAKETGGTFGEFQITADAQREQAIRQFADKGYSPIVLPGYSWETALRAVSPDYPDIDFVIIDTQVDLPNVRSVVFKEQEGSYLVGMLAAMASKTGTIGVVPAFNLPLLEAFACGYKHGAMAANPKVKVLENYIGSDFSAFNDPGKGSEAAKAQIDQGADVVYQVAGGAGLGVLQAAADAGKLGIGVDSNQNYIHPGQILTSMTKRVDVATYNAMMDFKKDPKAFQFGHITLGLKEGGVGAAMDDNNAKLITPEMKAAVDKASQDIISGAITVFDARGDGKCDI